MEKSFISTSSLAFIICIGFLSLSVNSFATKMAPMDIAEIHNEANTVAEVKILTSAISEYSYVIVHTGKKQPLIQHSAEITTAIKGESHKVTFLSRKGLKSGGEYLLFLNQNKSYPYLLVAQAGYGAIELDWVSMKGGFYKSARIPSTYISNILSTPQESGITKKSEVSEYIWVGTESLFKQLDRNK